MNIQKRYIILISFLLMFRLFPDGQEINSDSPNFLIIMSDQHAPQFSGVYGHSLVETPNLDKIAEQGVVFDNAYTTCPLCVPARMSFMTGKYIHNIGLWDNGVPLAEDEPTWAHYLRQEGYNVALSGKMHFRGHDQLHGYEEQLGIDMNGMNYPKPPDWSNKSLPEKKESKKTIGAGPGKNAVIDSDEYCTIKAIEYLKHSERKNKPWALTVGLVSPHPPFKVPSKYYEMYPEYKIDLPKISKNYIRKMHPSNQRLRHFYGFINQDVLPDNEIKKVRATYYGMVTYLDDLIGQMIETLSQTGQLDNTVIIYLSDHGEMLGEHGLWGKQNFYEESVRIPLIISFPKMFLQNHRVKYNVSNIDVTATILKIAGVDLNKLASSIDGRDLYNLLLDENYPWIDKVFSECHADLYTGPKAMFKRGKYKFIYYLGEEPELFDLENDPNEYINLANDPKMQQVRHTLEEELLSFWNPVKLEETIMKSQRKRHSLTPFLFDYIEEERSKWPEIFTRDLNKRY
jgi:choline-sulfatase